MPTTPALTRPPSPKTLRLAAERCEIPAIHPLPIGPWMFRIADLADPAIRLRVSRDRRRKGTGLEAEYPTLAYAST